MKIIVPHIGDTNNVIKLDNLVSQHIDVVKKYGNEKGWPLKLAVVKKTDKYIIAEIDDQDTEDVVCKATINESDGKDEIVQSLQSDVGFLA